MMRIRVHMVDMIFSQIWCHFTWLHHPLHIKRPEQLRLKACMNDRLTVVIVPIIVDMTARTIADMMEVSMDVMAPPMDEVVTAAFRRT